MKVGYNNFVAFKCADNIANLEGRNTEDSQIKHSNLVSNPQKASTNFVYPEYNIDNYKIKTPQKYTKLGVKELSGGLKVYSYKLANGYKVTVIPMEGSPTTVKNYVNVGSMNETDDIKGISHFLEHMAFNGTTGENGYIKLNSGDSFNKIDKLGGRTNASTSYALTDYYNTTPMLEDADLEEQIKIIAGMTEDLALTPEMIEKEKGPVCSEINMILDRPQTILMDQTVRTLFNVKSSADELIAGSTQHIKDLTREKVKAYYDKYYTPDNMNLVITGDVDPENVIKLVSKNFHSTKSKNGKLYEEKFTPIEKNIRKDFISDKATSANIAIGFVGPKNNDTKSKAIFDILINYLASVDVGISKELKNINADGDIWLETVSNNPNNSTMITYGIDCSEENSEKALKIIFDKLSTLKLPSESKLEIIKDGLLQDYKNALEYSYFVNDIVGNSIMNGDFDAIFDYEKIINSITVDDINNFIKDYLRLDRSAVTVVHPKTSIDKINENYLEAGKLSFKGRKIPVNKDKISEVTLGNNYKVGFYETNNDNITFNITLNQPINTSVSPAIRIIFNRILQNGTALATEDDFYKYQEENNLSLSAYNSVDFLELSGESSQKNFIKTLNKAKELLYTPRITEEELNKAKDSIKDSYSRRKDSSRSIYAEYESKNNPYYLSAERVLSELDSITLDDIKKYHEYLLNNSIGSITINIPKNNKEMKNISMRAFENLASVEEFNYTPAKVFKPNEKPVVLTKEKANSQADISEIFKFKFNNDLKEQATLNIMNTILSSSSTIGLFNTLREKEHLAYAVNSTYSIKGDCGEISCNILTTTDNKEIGEISYDNLQKSINGFNRQIGALLNSEYTDEDLENAKKTLKARLLEKEGTSSKLSALDEGQYSKYGIDYQNKLFNEIDNITRSDIDKFAKKVFNNPPVYSIVASKDTLEANKEYLQELENGKITL